MDLKSRNLNLLSYSKVFLTTLGLSLTISNISYALSQPSAYEIFKVPTTVKDLMQEEKAEFFRIEKQKYKLIEEKAKQAYLEAFWREEGKKISASSENAKIKYIQTRTSVSKKEIETSYKQYKDHPRLKDLSDTEKRGQVEKIVRYQKEQQVIEGIIDQGIQNRNLVILYPRPEEPRFNVPLTEGDFFRYGEEMDENTSIPKGCKEEKCPIRIVEYSEYECPFCARVIPSVKRIMREYKGKVVWSVRDFPLSFHQNARPAGMAAKCAGFQGKFWNMYGMLFNNQRKLTKTDLLSYGKELKLDKGRYESCLAGKSTEGKKASSLIDKGLSSGSQLGVTGTPAFFINGRRLSGALPYSEFKKVIEEELDLLKNKTAIKKG